MKRDIFQRKLKGFTLIELLVVLAIMGILVWSVLPSYQQLTERHQRMEGKLKLLEIQSHLERYFTSHNTYPEGLSNLAAYQNNQVQTENHYYQIALDTCEEGFCYELIAEHRSGKQDEELSLLSTGERKGPW